MEYTFYVRDAQGNVLATYTSTGSGTTLSGYALTLDEQHLYGASRLGIVNRSTNMKTAYTTPDTANFYRGLKYYELTNHLGNVLTTLSDKKLGHNAGNGTVDYYSADIVSASDYYPFGMQMPGRTFSGGIYRYGFNDKENDNEVKGEGNQQDYGMRIYDVRLARFLSVDPLTAKYAEWSPYPFAMNSPISGIDLDGLEYYFAADGSYIGVSKHNNDKDNPLKDKVFTGSVGKDGVSVTRGALIHDNYTEFKKVLGTVYNETSAK